jgi:REP element-mobilizing transposase RayT
MTNHVHLLLTPIEAGAVSSTMQDLGRRYVKYGNRVYGNPSAETRQAAQGRTGNVNLAPI